ncbi:hypothetical protein DDE19_28295 [Micromonospora ureilytica]|uniref:Uncharacterized protein n=1 Tax=Micromonospora ureilytica TaxID=709868 RepID=A0A3N9XHQ3_9ACTN|nr:hypothetical protein DDE19_28295 [Micromonospora ureilytica]
MLIVAITGSEDEQLRSGIVGAGHLRPSFTSESSASVVRCRPLARTVIAEIARANPAPAGVARLATLVGLHPLTGPERRRLATPGRHRGSGGGGTSPRGTPSNRAARPSRS